MARLLIPCLILIASAPALAAELQGTVVSVADGDTITVLDAEKTQHKIRLSGIDAPERRQAFGSKARDHLGKLVHEKPVTVRWHERDRYGRILGEVFIGETNVNREMVVDGMAWHYVRYSKSKSLADAEREARKAKRGLWVDPDPMPPWEFRKSATKPRAGRPMSSVSPAGLGIRSRASH